ncbi:MAG TPA: bifunctional 23S rRNA (guanine(2069)-N(7))-methyltransferase RlmK/23S rRNA (guanine(2445)-N(2))-methyltransferase RlmL [Stenotrophobium sp.]|nr:bifunctional 23S rRNA (guanine(2069)-N(7))-methyltransferase RlmK/23S rRNA (guanine(2445)-N(2))-methyltransferase RlmL [Stenotrophobium sp.]
MQTIPLFATCPRGVEPLLATELVTFGATGIKERTGGVACSGELATAYRACLWSRLASRVLMPLSTFPLTDVDALYAAAHAVDWPELFDLRSSFAIEVAGHSPNVTHTHYAGLKVKDAIADRFRALGGERPNVDTDNPDIRIHLHMDKLNGTLSLDLAGDSLHRRGYRARSVEAPLKENLAAAILIRAGWPELAAQGAPLLDPLCGSGTLVIEAAMIAADIAPGLLRARYGFESWLDHKPKVWKDLRTEAAARKAAGLARTLPPMAGQDLSSIAIKSARSNAERAGLGAHTQWTVMDASLARPIGERAGLLATNPPYGERLGAEAEIIKLYSLLGATLKQHFGGWHASIFTGRPDLGPRIGLRTSSMYALFNGALPCKLLNFEIPVLTESNAVSISGGEDFANRLRKNLKQLGRWVQRENVSNYRLYDADLPDYNLAVDVYQAAQLHVHVQEYAAPKTVDPVKAERRLREALTQIQQVLDVPGSRIHYKIRRAQKGTAQYQRQAEQEEFLQVEEHGCKLWVNFEDYLDTGLFLDHRPLRLRIQREAAGKRFLNLFAYTASTSVHAAVGGAAQTVSVDLSNTYLEWAERNFSLNGYAAQLPMSRTKPAASASPWGNHGGERAGSAYRGASANRPRSASKSHATAPHQLLRADCLQWLREQAAGPKPGRYDLILCDPPTFSNSKKMEGTLDTQRDHVELITLCAKLLAPGGTLYFSTNRRGFKLETAAFAQLDVKDITQQTLGEDFRRPPPMHRCWMIRNA